MASADLLSMDEKLFATLPCELISIVDGYYGRADEISWHALCVREYLRIQAKRRLLRWHDGNHSYSTFIRPYKTGPVIRVFVGSHLDLFGKWRCVSRTAFTYEELGERLIDAKLGPPWLTELRAQLDRSFSAWAIHRRRSKYSVWLRRSDRMLVKRGRWER